MRSRVALFALAGLVSGQNESATIDLSQPAPALTAESPFNTRPLQKSFAIIDGKQIAFYTNYPPDDAEDDDHDQDIHEEAAELAEEHDDPEAHRQKHAIDNEQVVIFLHGNPTSSYLWRNIVPYVEELDDDEHHRVRVIAPDLFGMGDSDKADVQESGVYTYIEHREKLFRFIELVAFGEGSGGNPVILVIHDWGSALGFDWASQNPDRVRAIAYMEAIVTPFPDESLETGVFGQLRSPDGEELVIENNAFVERILPSSILRGLSQAEFEVYNAPYQEPLDRWPTLEWPRQIPGTNPAPVNDIITAYNTWLTNDSADIPKLLVIAEPGVILTAEFLQMARSFENQTEVTVSGLHFLQEDSPDEIGEALRDFVEGLLQDHSHDHDDDGEGEDTDSVQVTDSADSFTTNLSMIVGLILFALSR